MTFLDSRPAPEVEFAKEIEAAEKELAAPPKEAEEPTIDAGSDTTESEKAEPAPKSEGPVRAETVEKPEPKEDHRVPVAELQRERQRRQEAEERERKWQEWYEANQRHQPKEQPEEDPLATIDENADPVALIAALKQEVISQRQRAQQQQEAEAKFRQQQEAVRRLETKTLADIETFQKDQPDYLQAVEYIRNSRLRELAALGYPPDQAAEALKQDSFNIAAAAAQQGDSYAKRLYELAKLRGYQPKKPEPSPAATAEDAVDIQAKRAEVATSLSKGGKRPSPEISAQDATKLTGAAFDSWWQKNMEPRKRTAADFSR